MSITDLAQIKLSKVEGAKELYILNEEIEIASPYMRVAFVENNNYGQMYLKLEFTDIGKDDNMRKFYTLVHTIENIFYRKLYE